MTIENRRGMTRAWLALWLALVAYAALVAPPDDPALTRALVKGTLSGDFGSVDPSIAAVFSILGVVPILASTFLLRDGASRRLPAWPFALAMFFVGAFALLPWLALRGLGGPRAQPRPSGKLRWLLATRFAGWAIVAALLGLSALGLLRGSAAAYARAFHSTAMVHIMTIDALLCAALVAWLAEQERAQGIVHTESRFARAVRFVPLFGTALWNALTRRAP